MSHAIRNTFATFSLPRHKNNPIFKQNVGKNYEKLLKEQAGVCAICGLTETHITINGSIKNLAYDHNHETNQFRGLLCTNCNLGIGNLKDSVEMLQKAIDYLNKWNNL